MRVLVVVSPPQCRRAKCLKLGREATDMRRVTSISVQILTQRLI